MVKSRVETAKSVLKAMGAPREQCNEQSALTLLGLLELGPTSPWPDAKAPLRGVTELMGWMAKIYGKQYAPNTRETIRRYTLHQFIEMGFVTLNSDDPKRPTNSPNNIYQIKSSVLRLLQSFETEA